MIYIFINLLTIELGGLLSRPLARILKDTHIDAMRLAAALAVLILGVKGAVKTQYELLLLLSLVLGGLIGTMLDLDGLFGRLAGFFQKKLGGGDDRFTQGLITVFMMQAVGAMAILGPLNAALQHDPTLILFKALLDFVSTFVYGTIYGKGVMLSGPLLFIYQGAIYLLAGLIAPFMTGVVLAEFAAVGSAVLLGLSLDMLGVIRFKSANFLPALLGPLVYFGIRQCF